MLCGTPLERQGGPSVSNNSSMFPPSKNFPRHTTCTPATLLNIFDFRWWRTLRRVRWWRTLSLTTSVNSWVVWGTATWLSDGSYYTLHRVRTCMHASAYCTHRKKNKQIHMVICANGRGSVTVQPPLQIASCIPCWLLYSVWKFFQISWVREWLRKISTAKFHNRCKVWLEARPWKFYPQKIVFEQNLAKPRNI